MGAGACVMACKVFCVRLDALCCHQMSQEPQASLADVAFLFIQFQACLFESLLYRLQSCVMLLCCAPIADNVIEVVAISFWNAAGADARP